MSVYKIIKMSGGSPKSWEQAVQNVVKEAVKDYPDISRLYVENFSCKVVKGKIKEYRATAKIMANI